jgi:hypothetical protein
MKISRRCLVLRDTHLLDTAQGQPL